MKKPELLAPAGNWEMLVTAVKSGADAVYFGLDMLNMRANARNFKLDDLKKIVGYCSENNVKAHLTVNSIVYNDELDKLDDLIRRAKEAGIARIICWDMSVIEKCIRYDIPFCISTQASVSNSAAVSMYKKLGAGRVVLARECTLEKIKEIKSSAEIEIETFVHGAMCVAVSGRCFMSHDAFGKSANRGECIQPCRREYEIHDTEGDGSFIIGEDYVMSPKDLCTIRFIDQLIEAGIDSFKIEGRKRSPDYIAKVISTYKKAIDLYFEGGLTDEIKEEMYAGLQKVYNRGFSDGFYFGTPQGDAFTDKYGSSATTKKSYAGKVVNYFTNKKVAHVKLESAGMKDNETVLIIGNKTGCIETRVQNMLIGGNAVTEAKKGDDITFVCTEDIRPRDKVYKIIEAGRK
jgi:putative protease